MLRFNELLLELLRDLDFFDSILSDLVDLMEVVDSCRRACSIVGILADITVSSGDLTCVAFDLSQRLIF